MTAYSFGMSFVSAAFAFAFAGGTARAGDLNPPGGPVAPTMKTLSQVEPRVAVNSANTPGDADSVFKITTSGSYYLAANLTGVAAKSGIEIAVDNVSLDLAGFSITGIAGALDGISASGRSNIAIRNGMIKSWPGEGIDLASSNQTRIEGIISTSNTSDGIRANNRTLIKDCISFANFGAGISAGSVVNVSGCLCFSNALAGITVNSVVSTITNCNVRSNQGQGIVAGNQTTISGCTSSSNASNGIEVNNSAHVYGNTCTSAGTGGTGSNIMVTGTDCRIEANSVSLGDFGIQVTGAGNIIIRNTCSGSATNWEIAADNVYGPIIDRTAPASPAVTGDFAASALGSDEPNANFTY